VTGSGEARPGGPSAGERAVIVPEAGRTVPTGEGISWNLSPRTASAVWPGSDGQPRLVQIMTAPVRHLHEVVREAQLGEEEWMAG